MREVSKENSDSTVSDSRGNRGGRYTLTPICHLVLSTLHVLKELDERDLAFMHQKKVHEVETAAEILEAKGYIKVREKILKLTKAGSMACGRRGLWIVLDTYHNIQDYGFIELYSQVFFSPYTKLLYREIRPFKKSFIAVGKSAQLREIWLKKVGYYTPLKYFKRAQVAFTEAVNYAGLSVEKAAKNNLAIAIKYLHYTQLALQRKTIEEPVITVEDLGEELEKTWQKITKLEETIENKLENTIS